MRTIRLPAGVTAVVKVCADVQPGEHAVVVTDTPKADIAELIAEGCRRAGAETVIVSMTPRSAHGEEPPSTVAAAMEAADVLFMPTSFSLSHAPARIRACQRGARALSMADLTLKQLSEGGLTADFEAEAIRVAWVTERLNAHQRLHITTPAGTDLTLSVAGRKANAADCLCRRPGMLGSPPDIEANVAPLETSAEGVAVIDGSIPHPELGLLKHPVILTFREGLIVAIEGGSEAAILRRILDAPGLDSTRVLAEFGVGLNRRAQLCGSMLEDEGADGTIHLGIGANLALGGTNRAPLHVDCVIRSATVMLDGDQFLIRDGNVQA